MCILQLFEEELKLYDLKVSFEAQESRKKNGYVRGKKMDRQNTTLCLAEIANCSLVFFLPVFLLVFVSSKFYWGTWIFNEKISIYLPKCIWVWSCEFSYMGYEQITCMAIQERKKPPTCLNYSILKYHSLLLRKLSLSHTW